MQNNTVQYMSSNYIRKIKFCLVVELTSEGSVRLWALWVAVRAGEEHGGGCTWMNERDYHPTPASTHPGF